MSIPVFVEFVGTIAGLKGAIDAADAEMTKLSRSGANTMTKLGAVSKAAVLGVGAAAVGIGAMAVTAASEFQRSMEMIHTQAGVAQDQVDKLSKGILNLAPSVGTGPDELATSLYHVESTLSASLDPATRYKLAMEQVKIAAEGAKVGNANLEDVTNALNATMASGMVPVGDMSKAMGALNAIVGSGDMHMQDLSEALGSGVLAVVKGYGVNLNDVGAALATFGDNNIRGADAATYLRTAVQAFAVPAKGGAKALKELGLSTTQLATDMQTGGLNKAIEDLHQRLVATGNDGDKAGELLTAAFGKKAGPGVQVLLGQFDRFEQKVTEVKDGANNFGDAWQQTTKTFAFQFDQVKTTVEALGIKLGTILIPYVEKTARAIEGVVVWLQKHKEVAEALGVAIGTVLAAALLAATVAFVQFTVALVTNPVFLIVAAIALLGVGIFELVKHWNTVWGEIKKLADDAWHFIDRVLVQPLVHAWGNVVHALDDAVSAISHAFDNVMHAVNNVWHVIDAAWHGMDAVFQFVANHWQAIVKIGLIVMFGLIGVAIDILWTHWKAVWGFIKDVTDAVWSFLRDHVFKPLGDFLTAVVVGALNILKGVFDVVWGGIKTAVSTVWDWLRDNVFDPLHVMLFATLAAALSILKKAFDTAWGGIKTAVSTVWDWLYDNVFQPLWSFVVNDITDAVNGLATTFDTVWHGIEDVIQAVWNVIKPILDTMKHAIDDTVGAVQKVAGFASKAAGGVSKGLGAAGRFIGIGADGGVVTKPTYSLIGEAGPEAVIPLNQMPGARALSGGDVLVHQTINLDGRTVYESLIPHAQADIRRGGFSPLAARGN